MESTGGKDIDERIESKAGRDKKDMKERMERTWRKGWKVKEEGMEHEGHGGKTATETR